MRWYEYFTSFAEAADFARTRASLTDDVAVLIWDGLQWRVEYTLSKKIITLNDDGEYLGPDYFDYESAPTERQRELGEIRSESIDDADSWARSDDEGWFYED